MISIIAVVGKNRAIGRNNQLLWNLPEDMKHFQEKTMGKTVVMGDRTFQSIGRPLPGRKNIVVTKLPDFKAVGVEIKNSLEEVLEEAKKSLDEIFIIGGGMIYSLSLPFADKLYLTVVDDAPKDADTFFPDYSGFSNFVNREDCNNGQYKFSFIELTR